MDDKYYFPHENDWQIIATLKEDRSSVSIERVDGSTIEVDIKGDYRELNALSEAFRKLGRKIYSEKEGKPRYPRKLSDKPLSEIKVGDRVKSLNTHSLGTVVGKSDKPDGDDYEVHIDWDNGKKSYKVWHMWLTSIEEVWEEVK